MKQSVRYVFLDILFMLTIVLTGGSQSAAIGSEPLTDYYGALQVNGNMLTDKNGRSVQLKGISSHGLSWFPEYSNFEMMKQMKQEWGCNVFRLALYTDDYNGYCSGDETNRAVLEEIIYEAVEAAKMLAMYVIIDWHILSDYSPLFNEQEAILFFDEMAERYKDEEHVLYEICNEPNGDTSWDDIKSYADKVIPVIRKHTDAIILVGCPTWSQDVHLAAQSPITGYDNLMYTLHFYAATHKEYLRLRMVSAIESGLPLFVSEFGICDASGDGAIDEQEANIWLQTMNDYSVSFVMWNLSNKNESSAMIKANCNKTSGFVSDDLSPAGIWFVSQMNHDVLNQSAPEEWR